MREWKERARLAMQALADAKHGQREAILSEIGGGVNLNTVRREIKVLAFFDLLERGAPGVAARLQDASFNFIEVLARWHDFDSDGAVAAARKLASGEYSLSSLQSAMRGAKTRVRRLSAEDFHARIRPSVKKQIQRLFGSPVNVTELPLPQPNRPKIDFLFAAGSPRQAESVAALIVGPYANAETYSKRRQDELLRAMGMAWIFDQIVVLLPGPGKLAEYEDSLRELLKVSRLTEKPRVHIIKLKGL